MTTRETAPRNDLIRMVSVPAGTKTRPIEIRSDSEGDGRTLVGYAAVFGTWTTINSWEGNFLERIAPSAFTKTIRESQPVVLFNHGFDPQIGDKPLGRVEVLEADRTGLWTETPLSHTSYNDDLIELLKDGAIDGMSFRFSVIRDEWNYPEEPTEHNPEMLPERTLVEVRLFEFGPVTFPAYAATTAGIRSRDEYLRWRETQGLIVEASPSEDAAGRSGTSEEAPDAPPTSGHPSVSKSDIRQLLVEVQKARLDPANDVEV